MTNVEFLKESWSDGDIVNVEGEVHAVTAVCFGTRTIQCKIDGEFVWINHRRIDSHKKCVKDADVVAEKDKEIEELKAKLEAAEDLKTKLVSLTDDFCNKYDELVP